MPAAQGLSQKCADTQVMTDWNRPPPENGTGVAKQEQCTLNWIQSLTRRRKGPVYHRK